MKIVDLLEVLFWEKIGHVKLFGFLVAKNVVLCFLSFVNGFRGFKTTSFRFSWFLLLFSNKLELEKQELKWSERFRSKIKGPTKIFFHGV